MSYLRVVEQQFDHGVTLPQEEEAPVAKPKEVPRQHEGRGCSVEFWAWNIRISWMLDAS